MRLFTSINSKSLGWIQACYIRQLLMLTCISSFLSSCTIRRTAESQTSKLYLAPFCLGGRRLSKGLWLFPCLSLCVACMKSVTVSAHPVWHLRAHYRTHSFLGRMKSLSHTNHRKETHSKWLEGKVCSSPLSHLPVIPAAASPLNIYNQLCRFNLIGLWWHQRGRMRWLNVHPPFHLEPCSV